MIHHRNDCHFGDLQCYEEGEYIYEQAVVNGHMPQEVKEQMLPIVLENYKIAHANQ